MRAPAAAVACWLAIAAPRESQAVDSPLDALLDRCRALRAAALAEIPPMQAICIAEINDGQSFGLWNEEEARFEEDRIRTIFEAPGNRYTRAGVSPAPPTPYEIIGRATKPFDTSTATSPVGIWLYARVRILDTLRADAEYQFCLAAVARAEEIWLTARNEGDLQPARLILNEALAWVCGPADGLARMRNSTASFRFYSYMRPSPTREIAADVVDAIGVIRSRSPRYFREIESDPAELAGTRLIWAALQKIGHRTLRRPLIAERIKELNAHFILACRAADDALDQAILRDAPAAEFEKLWQRAKAFRTPHLPEFNTSVSDYRSTVTIDYLNWIQVSVPDPMEPFQTPRENHSGGPLDSPARLAVGYEWWLQWRQAMEEGSRPAQTEEARQRLLGALSQFPAGVARKMAVRLNPPAPKPATLESASPRNLAVGKSAIARLLSALESSNAFSGNSEGPFAPDELSEAWRTLEQPAKAAHPQPRQFAYYWQAAAADPAQKILFQLRDEAAREALKKLPLPTEIFGSAETPLATLIDESLEAACLENRMDVAAQILAIDDAGCFLLGAEHARYVQTIGLLTQAQDSGTPVRPGQARFAYAQLLRTTTSLKLATRIAREVKSAASSQPEVPRR